MEIQELAVTEELVIKDFMLPISSDSPSGVSLKESTIYADIQEARAYDDPNLPRGVWDHDLKRSDWYRVSDLCQSSLITKTKDIQIAMWFLESQLKLRGIATLPVNLLLLAEITNDFWDNIHPLMVDGDIDYRINLFSWLNEKIAFPIRQLTIAETLSGDALTWMDWERANLLGSDEGNNQKNSPEINVASIKQGIDQTNVEFYQNFCQDLKDSLVALDYLGEVLANKLADDAPSLANLTDLLSVMLETIADLTGARSFVKDEENLSNQSTSETEFSADAARSQNISGSLNDRQKAYALLAEAAEYLVRDDPHSPVPYLVYKAIEWGHLSTSELYAEIFIKHEGNLNIFDVLGIERGEGR